MTYTEFPKAKILISKPRKADDRSYHPVREYLDRWMARARDADWSGMDDAGMYDSS